MGELLVELAGGVAELLVEGLIHVLVRQPVGRVALVLGVLGVVLVLLAYWASG